jgi:thioredoxin 1
MKKLMIGLAGLLAVSMVAFAQTTKTDTMTKSSSYVEYVAKDFQANTTSKRVLFFAAAWCPTCRGADAEFKAKLSEIPKDVVIYKTDYDTETALKQKYGITHQHTFVYVNAKAEAIKKWSGGAIVEIIANTKSAK